MEIMHAEKLKIALISRANCARARVKSFRSDFAAINVGLKAQGESHRFGKICTPIGAMRNAKNVGLVRA